MGANGTTLTDTAATFHADMVGAMCYMTSGDSAGEGREIASVASTTLTFTAPFSHEINTGDRYCVGGVPFKARCWPLQNPDVSRFNRWTTAGVMLKCRKLSGFTSNDNDYWRVGAYRGNRKQEETNVAYVDVTQNPSDSAGALNVDGVDIEPFVEQISAGTVFELTDAEFNVSWTDSRAINE